MKFTHPLINLFLEEKQYGQGLAETSLRSYRSAFVHLMHYDFLDLDDLSTFTPHNAKRFLYSASADYAWVPATYNRIRKDLKVFCKWLVTEKLIQENPFDSIPQKILPKKLPKGFTNDQIERMRYVLHRLFPDDSFVHMRAKAIFYTYLYSGIRLKELVGLSTEDINFDDSVILVRDGKGRKDRRVPLLRALEPILFSYVKIRDAQFPTAKHFFPTAFGGILQHREIYGIIKKMKRLLDFHITPHMFRHTFATELAKKNLNLWNISQILGHTNINTTKIYLSFQCADVGRQIDCLDIYK